MILINQKETEREELLRRCVNNMKTVLLEFARVSKEDDDILRSGGCKNVLLEDRYRPYGYSPRR